MLTPFRDILNHAARSLGLGPAVALAAARAHWPELVGQTLAKATEPRTIRGDTLMVVAAHALAAHELRLRQEEVLVRLRRISPGTETRRVLIMIRENSHR